ncbi:MAG: thioesterase family protein [bacterium]|jgi:acyl-CoA thioesterase FadM|nr:thioesterase family protein [candidate division KSB1 bacterium]MDH7558611.1 thioesterase family protein [bacterium]
MPRADIRALRHYLFMVDLKVRITDLNYGGHLGNDRLLGLLHEARVAFLASNGWSEMNCAGVGLIMGDAVLRYQGQAYAGDILRFEVGIGEPRRCGFRLYYRVTRPADGAAIALAETGMVCFDYREGKMCPLPAPVKDLCTSSLGTGERADP